MECQNVQALQRYRCLIAIARAVPDLCYLAQKSKSLKMEKFACGDGMCLKVIIKMQKQLKRPLIVTDGCILATLVKSIQMVLFVLRIGKKIY